MWTFLLVVYAFVVLFIGLGGAITFGVDASDDLTQARRNRDSYRGTVREGRAYDIAVRNAARFVLKTYVAVLLVAALWPVFAAVTPVVLLARLIREAI